MGLLFALVAVKKEASADPIPAPDAEADPYHHYRGYGGYGLGKRYGYYGYGKREAEADPHHHYYGGYGRKRYGYGYYGYGKRSASPEMTGLVA